MQHRCHASGKFPELEELCDQFATFNVDEATKNTVMEYDMVFASPWQAGQRCEIEPHEDGARFVKLSFLSGGTRPTTTSC